MYEKQPPTSTTCRANIPDKWIHGDDPSSVWNTISEEEGHSYDPSYECNMRFHFREGWVISICVIGRTSLFDLQFHRSGVENEPEWISCRCKWPFVPSLSQSVYCDHDPSSILPANTPREPGFRFGQLHGSLSHILYRRVTQTAIKLCRVFSLCS